ncbi:hypothetical protein DPEC_G00301370 [Dallia pectoralis]|uniref:Uncharacterized protein n=1 Tax=Dallia pectoralis TaxID=75939 RepID=A0ACC2FGU1_DALPE|nr:hypothetical protein DPEC_G00301370 [Dallia pectoralis]
MGQCPPVHLYLPSSRTPLIRLTRIPQDPGRCATQGRTPVTQLYLCDRQTGPSELTRCRAVCQVPPRSRSPGLDSGRDRLHIRHRQLPCRYPSPLPHRYH